MDVGGATGVYAFWLAEKGHEVHLLDIVPLHIEKAKKRNESAQHKVKESTLGDARQLPFADNTADVLLLFGPLYHLTDPADRAKALQ